MKTMFSNCILWTVCQTSPCVVYNNENVLKGVHSYNSVTCLIIIIIVRAAVVLLILLVLLNQVKVQ